MVRGRRARIRIVRPTIGVPWEHDWSPGGLMALITADQYKRLVSWCGGGGILMSVLGKWPGRISGKPATGFWAAKASDNANDLFDSVPEEAVNEVKRQAVSELQKAVAEAERKAHDMISTERAKMERTVAEAKRQAAEDALSVINQQEDSSEVNTRLKKKPRLCVIAPQTAVIGDVISQTGWCGGEICWGVS